MEALVCDIAGSTISLLSKAEPHVLPANNHLPPMTCGFQHDTLSVTCATYLYRYPILTTFYEQSSKLQGINHNGV